MPLEVATTDLPHLHYRRFLPAVVLRPWVQCYWSAWTESGATEDVVEKLYPDGGTTLIFDRDEGWVPMLHVSARTRPERFAPAVERVGIRFEPGGLFQLFGLSPADVDERAVALDVIWHGESMALSAAIAAAAITDRMELLERWLFAQAARLQPRAGRVQRLLPLLTAGAQEITELIRDQGLSRRTLERHFRREVGLTPGQIGHFHQLKRARLLLARSDLAISDVALACGFFDQAHFTHQFRAFTGETPAAYRRRKLTQIYKP